MQWNELHHLTRSLASFSASLHKRYIFFSSVVSSQSARKFFLYPLPCRGQGLQDSGNQPPVHGNILNGEREKKKWGLGRVLVGLWSLNSLKNSLENFLLCTALACVLFLRAQGPCLFDSCIFLLSPTNTQLGIAYEGVFLQND